MNLTSTLLADFEFDSATRLSSVICTQLKCSAAITDWKRELQNSCLIKITNLKTIIILGGK